MEKLRMTSSNLVKTNIDKLAELFPTVVTERLDDSGSLRQAIDFDLLRQELSEHVVEGAQERYNLDWPGKRAALLAANAPIAKTLRPKRAESVNFDDTKNVFIEGDNLEALKLLQESYLGKIRLIYIDPPYNTGHDFLYEDNFSETSDEYLVRSGQAASDGTRMVGNTESNGRFHSDWLSMMYPRLKLAWNLLAEDGYIFISIDDNEVANLRRMCDEVFGADNFITSFAWQKTLTRRNDATYVSNAHEYLLCYARSFGSSGFNKVEPDAKQRATYTNRDNDPRGDWLAVPFHAPNIRPNLTYPITTPSGRVLMPPSGRCWSTTKEQFEQLLADGRIYFGKNGDGMAQRKKFWAERDNGMVPWTWWPHDEAGENRGATKEIKDLFDGDVVFTAPKPTKLIAKILELIPARDENIVLDFFAGSGTTADAVMRWNEFGKSQWNFILVQAAEACDPKSVAGAAGYKTISEVSRERIRRAGLRSLEGSGLRSESLDVGFRSLYVDTTNMVDVFRTPEQTSQLALDELEGSVKSDRSEEDLLFQVLVDWGLELSVAISIEQLDSCSAIIVEGGALIACFDSHVTAETIRLIAEKKPLRAVFRDSSFSSDSERINAEQVFREISPETEVKAI